MASVARRPDGRWRARYNDTSGREHAKHFDRRGETERWLTEQQSKINRGEWIDPVLSQITIGQWSETWLASKAGLKPTAKRSYEEVYRSLVAPRWANIALAKVTYADAVVWLAELGGAERNLSASRRRHALMVLKQLAELAVFDGRLARNVVKPVKAPRVVRSEPRFITHDQLAALAQECKEFEVFVLLLGYTGIRWGEARALRVRHLDLMRGRVHVVENLPDGSAEEEVVAPKSHRRRVVPMPAFVRDLLTLHVAGKSPDERVFVNSRGGLLYNSNFRRNRFDRAVAAVGIAPFTPHQLRDTAASLAVSSGANVKVVQRMLGHASAAMTLDIYAALWADDLDDIALRLNVAGIKARGRLSEASVLSLTAAVVAP